MGLGAMEEAWTIRVEIHVLSSLICEEFGQHVAMKLKGIRSTHVEMHFVCSLPRDGFGEHILRCILCPR
jgi:hypothetical protein